MVIWQNPPRLIAPRADHFPTRAARRRMKNETIFEVPNTPENETLYPEMQLFEAEMRPEIESKAGNGV